MDPTAARFVRESQLRTSRAPTADLAGAALEAQQAAGLIAGADFIIIAVKPGTAGDAIDRIKALVPPEPDA